MARLALTLTLLTTALFIIFSEALHHPFDLPNDDVSSIRRPSITLPDEKSKRMILLPSEKPEVEPATMVKLDQNEISEPEEMIEEEMEPEVHVAFRDLKPVWSQDGDDDERKMFVFRHPRHRCHHPHRRPFPFNHHTKFYHQFDVKRPMPEFRHDEVSYGNDMLVDHEPETIRGEVSYGNDMLVADPEMERESGFGGEELTQDLTEIPMGRDGREHRHAPSGWFGLHFGGRPRFPDEPHHHHHHHHDHDDEDHHHDHHHHEEDDRPDHHREERDEEEHRRPDHHHEDRDEEEHRRPDEEDVMRKRPFRHGRREEGGGGLVKRVRKFLHQFEF